MVATAANPITSIEGLTVALSAGGGTIDHVDFGGMRACMSRDVAQAIVRRARARQDHSSGAETMSAPVQAAKPAIERVPPRPTPVVPTPAPRPPKRLLTAADVHRLRAELDGLAASSPAIALKVWKGNDWVRQEFGDNYRTYEMYLNDIASKVPHPQSPSQSDARFEADIRGSMPVSLLAEQHWNAKDAACEGFASQRGYELYLEEERRQSLMCGG